MKKTIGALYNEETGEVLLYLRKPVGKEWICAYPFIDNSTVSIWVSGKR